MNEPPFSLTSSQFPPSHAKVFAELIHSSFRFNRNRNRGFVVVLLVAVVVSMSPAAEEQVQKVLTLDHSNFSDIVSEHDFIVVQFYTPWCRYSKALAPEYEKAALILSNHDPPIVLAKVDANEPNSELVSEFQVKGFPTIKILRSGGKSIKEYYGPREADDIADYLKEQVRPLSTEIKSVEDTSSLIDEKKIFIFNGEEFENFMALADKLRSDYDFCHTLDAKLLPRGEPVSKPTLRLLKPFDELFVDSQEFEVDAMEKFITEFTIPIVTVWNNDPSIFPFAGKFFQDPGSKVMLFVNFNKDHDDFQAKYKNVATLYRGKGLSFLFGNADTTKNAFQYFGFNAEQAPVVILLHEDGKRFRKENVEPDQIESWVKDCVEGKVQPYIRSEPIPEDDNEPVKTVVRNSIQDIVFNSGKNVVIMFYAPWCLHSKRLAPILDEVATSFEKDPSVLVAKFDATVNDVPRDTFEVQGFPTLYVRSANGNLSKMYDGAGTTEDIIDFVNIYRDKLAGAFVGTTRNNELAK